MASYVLCMAGDSIKSERREDFSIMITERLPYRPPGSRDTGVSFYVCLHIVNVFCAGDLSS